MHTISKAVIKKDHTEKMNGDTKYIDDMRIENMLHGAVLRSTQSHAKIKKIRIPDLEEGYRIVDYKDVLGINLLKVVTSEQPIFAEDRVRFIGENILMVVGKESSKVKEIINSIEVEYEVLAPVYKMADATSFAAEYDYEHGNPDEAFKKAAYTFEEVFETGYQEQAYLEPQGAIGIFENGLVTVYGSMQCPYYVKNAVIQTTGLDGDHVRIIQTTTGGAFGGKEDYPSMLGCMVAVAAMACEQPVKLVYNRREDMSVTPKRHPASIKYKIGLDENYKVTALEANILLDAGAYAGLSNVVLQRALIALGGVYRIPNIKAVGKAALTNTVPSGAFRGFGAPQTFFATEMLFTHMAKALDIDVKTFKMDNIVVIGDQSATKGEFHHEVKMPEMMERMEVLSDYSKKVQLYKNQTGRYRKGVGLSLFFHGCGFTGSAEQDYIKSIVYLKKYPDGFVEILVSNTDMGQGLKTTFSKIVAESVGISLDKVIIVNPDTRRVPDSGPTVASRSIMIVGKLLERAGKRLKETWIDGQEQVIEEHYKHVEMIPWDITTFTGDAYPTYSWGINVIEVQVDTLIGSSELLNVWAIYDAGTLIDETIMQGQMEGGLAQAIGYASMEYMVADKGRIPQASMTDYIIPTSKDTINYHVEFVDNHYEDGPFGAKGAGELPLIGGAPAYVDAIEMAVNKPINHIPVRPEEIVNMVD